MEQSMQDFGGSVKAAASVMALALWLAPTSAPAQSVPDFRIPGSRPTSDPRAQGPVDSDAPIIRSPAPRPVPTPSPVPVASPTATPSAPITTAPSPRDTGPARAPAPLPRTTAGPQPVASPAAAPSPATATVAPLPLPASSGLPAAPATDSLVKPAPAPAASGSLWPWLAGGAALLALAFAGLWWRSRSKPQPLLEFVPPVVPAPAPAPAPPTKQQAQPAAAARPAQVPEPQLSAALPGLGIALEARRMSASLMATTLSYTLTLTNNGPETLSALAVEGDMIAAHASLPPEQQIASDHQRLELRHALVTLAPGESAEFTGDFRLPLTALNPIRAGDAAFFVPLARLRVEASTTAGKPLVQVQTYVVGETGDAPGAGLRPFRLDLGPRTYSRISQRAVN